MIALFASGPVLNFIAGFGTRFGIPVRINTLITLPSMGQGSGIPVSI